ncbi:hypothetical protein EJB05_12313 [Eragrostis curvula]|uniref:Uncharacterized protein n=1 Tax=Eragrostis curvula TaxID=38414 RepID=A0A5J9VTH6_9POAL|nr:hypothetical protein EJB05_12313 [Eragrostis curvula]
MPGQCRWRPEGIRFPRRDRLITAVPARVVAAAAPPAPMANPGEARRRRAHQRVHGGACLPSAARGPTRHQIAVPAPRTRSPATPRARFVAVGAADVVVVPHVLAGPIKLAVAARASPRQTTSMERAPAMESTAARR